MSGCSIGSEDERAVAELRHEVVLLEIVQEVGEDGGRHVREGAGLAEQGLLTAPRFQPAPDIRDEDVAHVIAILHLRIVRYLQRRGRLAREEHAEHDEPVPDEPLLALMSAASVEGRVALGPESGQPLTRRGRQRDRRPLLLPGELCCHLEGFLLHAKVAIEGHDRAGLERLCRYIARPAIASERLSIDADGRVVYRLRRARRDGTNAIVFEPLAFLERLAARVPRPRAHLLKYHGVLAPAAQLECPGSSRSDESRRRISVVAKGIPPHRARTARTDRVASRFDGNATPSARALPTSTPRSRTQPEKARAN